MKPNRKGVSRKLFLVFMAGMFMLSSACSSPKAAGTWGSNPADLHWPSDRIFPQFEKPDTLDVVDLSKAPDDIRSLLVSLQGLVNRKKPRIYVTENTGEGETFWIDRLQVPTKTTIKDPLSLIAKYRGEIDGIVIYDPEQPDTLNLATVIAGAQKGIVASPELAEKLSPPPYELKTLSDLRSLHFRSKLDVYRYAKEHYWSQTTNRLIVGLSPATKGYLRDYAVATQAMVIWLDARNASEKELLDSFLQEMPPTSPYIGWWPEEDSGVTAASVYGIPVFAADFASNLTVFGGVEQKLAPPPAPKKPALQNKIYVALFMSDGDNIQENQHLFVSRWNDPNRGIVPIGWTMSPGLVDLAPTILHYYQSTATENDVIVSGPSGLGYTKPDNWPTDKLTAYAKLSNQYLARAGMNIVTIWNDQSPVQTGVSTVYSSLMTNLIGATLQKRSHPDTTGLKYFGRHLPMISFKVPYASNTNDMIAGIEDALKDWNGKEPKFVAIQQNTNKMTVTHLVMVQNHFEDNPDIVFIRPDHFFELIREYGSGK